MRSFRVLAPLIAIALGTAAAAQPDCDATKCSVTLTAEQLLHSADRLVASGRFAEARPLIAALAQAPGFDMERRFLQGYVAVETGDPKTAIKHFRTVLAMRPDITRARLELARALMMVGRDAAADYHYRLAQEDGALPPEIGRTIYAARSLIRSRQRFEFNFSFGLAPDTNINSATRDRTIDAYFGDSAIPLELSEDARERTGLGQIGTAWGSVRLPLADEFNMLVEADARGTNYRGGDADDLSLQLAAGPEWQVEQTRLSLSATASRRWYGGDVVQRSVGGRFSSQHALGAGARLAAQFDARRLDSGFNPGLDGWSLGGSLTFEHVLRRSLVASITGFGLWEPLEARGYANTEAGVAAGIGGELPWGINAGLSGSVSRAWYDAAIPLFGNEPRRDWRFLGRLYVGARNRRYFGFSPSVAYTFRSAGSNLDLHDFSRHRFEFALARYF
jgi:hypothetical protein